jgi:preprotein translocase subunit SecA
MTSAKRTELIARAMLIEDLLRQEKSLDHILEESITRVREAMEIIFQNRRFDNLEERFIFLQLLVSH